MNTAAVSWSFNRWFRLIGTPLMGGLIYAIIYYINPRSFEDDPHYHGDSAWQTYGLDLLASLVGAFLLSETSIRLIPLLDRLVSWDRPVLRSFAQLLTLVVASVGIIWLLVLVTTWLQDAHYQFTETDLLSIRQTVVFGSLMALFINAIQTGEYFFSRWRTTQLEAERLKRESAEARYEALKNQLDPHFLFNNLNTLLAVVDEAPEQATDFVTNLSAVYRYVLHQRDQPLVTLADELTLARAYLYLLDKRFGANLRARIDIPDTYHAWQLPPLTLQLLLENAVKHNVVSRANPLCIGLTVNETHQLVVVNNHQPKRPAQSADPTGLSPSGLGLTNIENRYHLLGGPTPTVRQTADAFTVQLPLLAP